MIRFVLAALLAMPASALAQSHQPYSGMEQRSVKALSEQQIADLKAGRGMGLALAAELNGYPGPMHVLEHATALALTAEQRDRTRTLFEAMKAEAVPVGELLIEQETKLDRLFAGREITAASLRAVTEQIGATQARLREAHLKYHLAMVTLLNPEQINLYRKLRGYGQQHIPQHGHHR
jgi:Spy/CpxP family protein refolding chaperone